jgi:hypothetical protein
MGVVTNLFTFIIAAFGIVRFRKDGFASVEAVDQVFCRNAMKIIKESTSAI